jgi:hypothetical protein
MDIIYKIDEGVYNQPDYNKTSVYIKGQRWFYDLTHKKENSIDKSLFGYIGNEQTKHSIIVAYTPNTIPGYYNDNRLYRQRNGKKVYLYSVFKDELSLYEYMKNMNVENRCFYEVIIGKTQQKIKFDIDIAKDNLTDTEFNKIFNEVFNELMSGIVSTLNDLDFVYDLNNIMLFTSHNENKKSGHVILDRVNVNSNKHAEKFYKDVMIYCPNYKQYIDHKIYNSNQQFRLYLSSKIGQNRIKKFMPSFVYKNKLYKYKIDYIDYYNKLPNTTDEEKEFRNKFKEIKIFTGSLINFIDYPCINIQLEQKEATIHERINDKNINGVLAIIDRDYKNIYKFDKVSIDGSICLNRLIPSYCNVCKRIHHNIDSFIYTKENQYFLNCRRSNIPTLLNYTEPIKIDLKLN